MSTKSPPPQHHTENFVQERVALVECPARIHLGFVDLNGDGGRRFGSLGLSIDDISTIVAASPAMSLQVNGNEQQRATQYARQVQKAFGLDANVALDIKQTIPQHAGLGSGTQLALAVGAAIAVAHGLPHDARTLASMTDRGRRSGIGIGVFERGGFVCDAGRGPQTDIPPIIARYEFPRHWSVVLVMDARHQGLNGEQERRAFEHASPMPSSQADALCRASLMGVFPALLEQDFALFSRSIRFIQDAIGEYFSAWQGGRYASAAVATAMGEIEDRYGILGLGQSSWGPTGFAFVEHADRAEKIVDEMTASYEAAGGGLRFSVHRGRNDGARISHGRSVPKGVELSA